MTMPKDSDPQAGTQGVPTPKVSDASAQPSSNGNSSDDAYERAKRELRAEFQAELKAAQSAKDKRLKPFERALPVLEALEPYLKAAGGDIKKAAREFEIDQMLEGGSAGTTPTPETHPQVSDLERNTAEILTEAGISPDDQDYQELLKGNYAKEGDWYKAVTKLAARKVKGTATAPEVPPTHVNDAQGKTPAASDDPTKQLDKVPFGDSKTLYQMAKKDIAKGRRSGD